MRMLVLGAALAAVVAIPATGASAQRYGGYGYGSGYGYQPTHRNREVRSEVAECRRELRRADNRWEYQRELRECRREIAEARRDGRYGNRYHGNRYGRDDYRYGNGSRWR